MDERSYIKDLIRNKPEKSEERAQMALQMKDPVLKILAMIMHQIGDNYGPHIYSELIKTHFISADDYFTIFQDLQREVDHETLKKNYPATS